MTLLEIPHARSAAGHRVSLSGGVAVLSRRAEATVQSLIGSADRTLYEAKRLGRNRMVAAHPEAGAEAAAV